MTRMDIPTMAKQINLLAEVFDRKPVSEHAAVAWFDALRDFPVERVTGILIAWPKYHAKMPVPHDVYRECNERNVAEIEAKARAEAQKNRREFHPGVGGRQAEEFLKQIRGVFKRPRWTPVQHWERVLRDAPEGSIGKRFAAEALKELRGRRGEKAVEREPGEDEEEN